MANESQQIDLVAAVRMTKRARTLGLLTVEGWLFHREILDQILAQPNVTGIRFYLGVDQGNAPTLVGVGTLADDKDLTDGVLAEFGLPCPPYCDPGSALHVGTA